MVEYVKGLMNDLKNGNNRKLLDMVKEMERMMRKGKLEIEDARKKVRVPEEGKMEVICKLKRIEGSLKRKKQQLCLPEPPTRRVGYSGPATPHKDNASSLAAWVKRTDAREIESFYQQYYEQYVRSLDQGDNVTPDPKRHRV
ncbi:uncharacterized protein [Euphorbia lathyris]|uniref:uncharacterized protein n=1 Tax=Euphorbia lathyris TaxID=212925 RepID=UPI003313FEEB